MNTEIINSILNIDANSPHALARQAKKHLGVSLGDTFYAVCTGLYEYGYKMEFGEAGLPGTSKKLVNMGVFRIDGDRLYLNKDIENKVADLEAKHSHFLVKLEARVKEQLNK